jgi:DNA invertase Pin-like site-specific DNA recombinase
MPMYGYARVSTNGQDLTAQDRPTRRGSTAAAFAQYAVELTAPSPPTRRR